MIIQAGSHEVLLDDAVRLAQQAATADVEVTLDITPGVPHVFQNFYPILDEAVYTPPPASLRYLDTFAKIDGGWYFAERKLLLDWSETRPSTPGT